MEFRVMDARENASKLIKQVPDGERSRGFGSLPSLTAILPANWDSEEASDQVAEQFDVIKELNAGKLRTPAEE